MPPDKVYIVGVAPGGASSLPLKLRRMINQADIVFGGERLLDMFPSLGGQKITIANNLSDIVEIISANLREKRMVVLASGDPGFYGIAGYLRGRLGQEAIEVIPNVSAMQLAFARIGESWDDAVLTSVHARPIEDIIGLVRSHSKIGLFTDDRHTPGEIARVLCQHGLENYRAYVCQDLGTAEESIVATDLYSLKEREFSPLNVVILIRDKSARGTRPQQLLGIPEKDFERRKPERGLITKLEVRAVSLAKLRLTENSIVWDIGAGSGAISIEASLLARRGTVFAIEKNDEDISIITENVRRFARDNIRVIQAVAPAKFEELPDPDSVFVGGSGGQLAEVIAVACQRLKPGGRMVINAATLETLNTAVESLKVNGFAADTTLVSIARSKDISDLTRLEALNPVFIITGWRHAEGVSENGG